MEGSYEKTHLAILIGVVSITLLSILFINANFFSTYEDAYAQLQNEYKGEFIKLADDNVLVIDGAGDVSFASVAKNNFFHVYRKFVVFPTNLNVYELEDPDAIPYISVDNSETTIGLITNEEVKYAVYDPGFGEEYREEEAIEIVNLHEYVDNIDKNNKFWFVYASVSPQQVSTIIFLDENKQTLEIDSRDFELK